MRLRLIETSSEKRKFMGAAIHGGFGAGKIGRIGGGVMLRIGLFFPFQAAPNIADTRAMTRQRLGPAIHTFFHFSAQHLVPVGFGDGVFQDNNIAPVLEGFNVHFSPISGWGDTVSGKRPYRYGRPLSLPHRQEMPFLATAANNP